MKINVKLTTHLQEKEGMFYKHAFLLLEVSGQFHVPVPLPLTTILSEARWFPEHVYPCLCAVKFIPSAKWNLVSDTTFCTISKVKLLKVNRNVSTFLFTLSFSWELYWDDSRNSLPVFIIVGLIITPPHIIAVLINVKHEKCGIIKS